MASPSTAACGSEKGWPSTLLTSVKALDVWDEVAHPSGQDDLLAPPLQQAGGAGRKVIAALHTTVQHCAPVARMAPDQKTNFNVVAMQGRTQDAEMKLLVCRCWW